VGGTNLRRAKERAQLRRYAVQVLDVEVERHQVGAGRGLAVQAPDRILHVVFVRDGVDV
jgi:hypothetical protein